VNDRIHQEVEVDRLRDQRVEARIQGARAVVSGCVAGAGDHGRAPSRRSRRIAQPPDELIAIVDRHADV